MCIYYMEFNNKTIGSIVFILILIIIFIGGIYVYNITNQYKQFCIDNNLNYSNDNTCFSVKDNFIKYYSISNIKGKLFLKEIK
jgi:hypothetical protein